MRQINKILLHCSASDAPRADNIKEIRRWHLNRGFTDVGYHFFIRKDGTTEAGRPMSEIGAHCKGQNHDSIGICLSGLNSFTQQQVANLNSLIKTVNTIVGKTLPIYPHNYFDKRKTCPNVKLPNFLEGDIQILYQYVAKGEIIDGDPGEFDEDTEEEFK